MRARTYILTVLLAVTFAAAQNRTPQSVVPPAAAQLAAVSAVESTLAQETAPPSSRTANPGAGKRDPFVSVIRSVVAGPACGTGKKCLIIDQIQLKGVVKSQEGMLAVVENPQRKSYFLRENDPVFNGIVVKITGDSIVFRETVTDRAGRSFAKEIVKRLRPS